MNRLLAAAFRATSLAPLVAEHQAFHEAIAAAAGRQIDGLEATDCTGVVTGNADLAESCTWEPPAIPEIPTPVYHYPTAADLAEIGLVAP